MDRISGLPDGVACHILSFLPTKMSVQTSVLAKRWRLLWANVPDLHFNDGYNHSRRKSFHNLVNRVMSRHKVHNINTFSLTFEYDSNRVEFEKCIATVVARNVRSVEISQNCMLRLPKCLLTCKTLVDLRLWGCMDIIVSDTPVYLPALKKLYLGYVQNEDAKYHPHLLSGCPVLEELTIQRDNSLNLLVSSPTLTRLDLETLETISRNVEELSGVKINTPAIRYLRLHDNVSESFSAGPLTFLNEADVAFNGLLESDDLELEMHEEGERSVLYSRNVFEFVGKLCNVNRLKLSIGKMVVYDSTFSALSIKFHNLTELELAGDWRLISSFLENADNLQVLRISLVDDDNKYWTEPHQVPTSLSSRLRIVTILEFRRREGVLELTRYLLKNAKVLKLMEIKCMRGLDSNRKKDALKRISKFPRGSVECEVQLH